MSISTLRKSLYASALVLTLATVGGTHFFDLQQSHAEGEKSQAAPAPATPVSVAVVQPKLVTQWSEFSGRLEAVDAVEVRSRVAGAIQSVAFKEGAIVKQGDLWSRSIQRRMRQKLRAQRRRWPPPNRSSPMPRANLNAASSS